MNADLISFSGIVLMFVLGLRHGLDPDHIACIDGLTWSTLDNNQKLAPWVGTLFALGHGLLVTAIAVGVNQLSRGIHVPDTVVTVFGWVPTLLLLLVGTLNLRQLLIPGQAYQPTGWKMRLIPRRLRNKSNPLAIVLIGVLFASVFDTATQASAWGYVATNNGGIQAAMGAGLVFTLGMIITDTVDGRLLCHIVRRADGEAAGRRYRRTLGWLIVALSYSVAAYNIGKEIVPAIELGEFGYSMAGALLLAVVFVMWAWTYRSRLKFV
ncbi:nickel permease [Hydrogenophaga sp. PAMC20947]|uniref:HoxN/HupN/NixA family nickel/cobalt transporter n=1 Tax=Hydrogenophaga sp. PAMC20947 TaxID=2565558 RepID=UPI00109DF730|nr:nickel permease [Hydrogenophaga sp. PAMC20947]QCB45152.1 nickel permease [Hydrogenophaga sp. PAMC20947]